MSGLGQVESRSAAAERTTTYSADERAVAGSNSPTGPPRPSKLNQVVQNFYMKAALIIVQARQPVTPLYNKASNHKRLNKWFNVDTLETDAFKDELRFWKTIDVSSPSFRESPSMIIEVILHARDLTPNQTLVVIDQAGRRTDVEYGGSRRRHSVNTIVLERWQVQWERPNDGAAPELPVTYKKSIVVFRSLFALTKLLPAWQLRKRLARSKLTGNSLRIVCQILSSESDTDTSSRIGLTQSLVAGVKDKVESFHFHKIDTAAGKLCLKVDYRSQCDFRVDDSEALLSSQFLNSDQSYTQRPPSSLPNESARRLNRPGSYTQLSSSNNSLPYMMAPDYRASQPRTERRPSAALLQPFKSPSLSASPSLDLMSNSPRNISRTPSSISMERNSARTSGYPQSQRIPSSHGESPMFTATNSPRPQSQAPQLIKRYSSSFGQRSGSFSGRRRPSQASDAAVNLDASTQRSLSQSPSILSPNADEQDLGDFVNLLDNRKPLVGTQFRDDVLSNSRISSENMLQRSQADLGKFQRLKESHMFLSNSLIQSSSAKSPEVQSALKPAVSPIMTHISAGSASPGKSISPHTPAIPSRLSESSVIPRGKTRGEAFKKTELAPFWGRASPDMPSSGVSSSERSDPGRNLQYPDHEEKDSMENQQREKRTDRTAQGHSASRPNSGPLRSGLARSRSASSSSSSVRMNHNANAGAQRPSIARESPAEMNMDAALPGPTGPQLSSLVVDDDELFFAMSDIHLGATKSADP